MHSELKPNHITWHAYTTKLRLRNFNRRINFISNYIDIHENIFFDSIITASTSQNDIMCTFTQVFFFGNGLEKKEGELINVSGVTWKWTIFECVYTFLNPLLSCHECMAGNLLLFIWISTNNFQMNEFVNFHLFNFMPFVKPALIIHVFHWTIPV